MKTSESIKSIGKALNEAQKQMGAVKKGASNPFFKSKYADLTSVIEVVKEPLNNNGITILQPHNTKIEMSATSGTNEVVHFVETILLHESGEFISSETPVFLPEKKKDDPQALGSAITYARRYGLQSLLSIPAEDDDGEKAMNRTSTPPLKKKETQPTKKSGLRRL